MSSKRGNTKRVFWKAVTYFGTAACWGLPIRDDYAFYNLRLENESGMKVTCEWSGKEYFKSGPRIIDIHLRRVVPQASDRRYMRSWCSRRLGHRSERKHQGQERT